MKYQIKNKSNIKIFINLNVLIFILTSCLSSAVDSSITEISPNPNIKITTPTVTQAVSKTQTPIPSLSVEDAEARVLEFLKTNTGCVLPCWWGITPGITTSDEISSILESFLGLVVSEVRYEFSESGGSLLMRPLSNGIRVGIQYLIHENAISMIYVKTEMTENTYDLVYADSFYQEVMSEYTLEVILTRYGKPNQILVRSFSDLAGHFNPFQTLLYYPDKGIVVQYFSPNGLITENDEFILPTCPPIGHISLRLCPRFKNDIKRNTTD
ncbi:MAG TPA: hypothetical protein DEP19_02710 [Anaerolineae bacterium]|nr:hypothetical protein [Anaerolineae bacterium]